MNSFCRADCSIYHALGYGVFMYLKAVMTFEQKHIEEASAVLSQACENIDSYRHFMNICYIIIKPEPIVIFTTLNEN